MLGALSSPPLLPAQQSGRSAEKARRLCCWRFFVQRVRDVMRGRTHAAAVVCVVASAAAMAERKQCGNRAAEPSRGAAVCSPWNGFNPGKTTDPHGDRVSDRPHRSQAKVWGRLPGTTYLYSQPFVDGSSFNAHAHGGTGPVPTSFLIFFKASMKMLNGHACAWFPWFLHPG